MTFALLAIATAWIAGPDTCTSCGACGPVRKVCRAVCETKEVKETTWTCETEDFCIPGRSHKTLGIDCQGKPCTLWHPGCAEVRTRNQLVKRDETKQVPEVRWVVERLCANCCGSQGVASDPASPFGVSRRSGRGTVKVSRKPPEPERGEPH